MTSLSIALLLLASCGGGGGGAGGSGPPMATSAITSPSADGLVFDPTRSIRGRTSANRPIGAVFVNGIPASTTDGFASWQVDLPLPLGPSEIEVEVRDPIGGLLSLSVERRLNRQEVAAREFFGVTIDRASEQGRAIVSTSNGFFLVALDLATSTLSVVRPFAPGTDFGSALVEHPLAWDPGRDEIYYLVPGTGFVRSPAAGGPEELLVADGLGEIATANVRSAQFDSAHDAVVLGGGFDLAQGAGSILRIDAQTTAHELMATGAELGVYFPMAIGLGISASANFYALRNLETDPFLIRVDATTGASSVDFMPFSPSESLSPLVSGAIVPDLDDVGYITTRRHEIVVGNAGIGNGLPFAEFTGDLLHEAIFPRLSTNDFVAVAGSRVTRFDRATGAATSLSFGTRGLGAAPPEMSIWTPVVPCAVRSGGELVVPRVGLAQRVDVETGDRREDFVTGPMGTGFTSLVKSLDAVRDEPRGRTLDLISTPLVGGGGFTNSIRVLDLDLEIGLATPIAEYTSASATGQLVYDSARDRYLIVGADPEIRVFDPTTDLVSVVGVLPAEAQAGAGGFLVPTIDLVADRLLMLRDGTLGASTTRVDVDLETFATTTTTLDLSATPAAGRDLRNGAVHASIGRGRVVTSSPSGDENPPVVALDLLAGTAELVPTTGAGLDVGAELVVISLPENEDSVLVFGTRGVFSLDLVDGGMVLVSR